jgi:hypothetical protein
LEERLDRTQEVAGSSPASSIVRNACSSVASPSDRAPKLTRSGPSPSAQVCLLALALLASSATALRLHRAALFGQPVYVTSPPNDSHLASA